MEVRRVCDEITSLWLDLGNVLIHFDPVKLWHQVGTTLSISPDEARHRLGQDQLQGRYEKGLIDTETFLRRLAMDRPWTPRLAQDLSSAFCDIFLPNTAMIDWSLNMQSQGLRLVLVSNSNKLHIDYVRRSFRLLEYFDHLVISFEINAMKPEMEFFEKAIAKTGDEAPHKALYIDDLAENIQSGTDFGLRSVQFSDFSNFQKWLADARLSFRIN